MALITAETKKSNIKFKKKKRMPNSIIGVIIVFGTIAVFIMGFVIYGIYESSKKPDGINDKLYQIGKNAINVADDYIDLKIDHEMAIDRILRLLSDAKDLCDKNGDDEIDYDVLNPNYEVYHCINHLESIIYFNDSYYDLLEGRNDLAEALNIKSK